MRLGDRDFQVLILKTAVSDLEVEEPSVVVQLHLLLLQLSYGLLLLIAESPSFHAVEAYLLDLLVQGSQLGLLLGLELILIGLLLQGDQVLLHLQHVISVGCQSRLLELLQDTLQLGVELLDLQVDLVLELLNLLLVIHCVLAILAAVHPGQLRGEGIIEISGRLLHYRMKMVAGRLLVSPER